MSGWHLLQIYKPVLRVAGLPNAADERQGAVIHVNGIYNSLRLVRLNLLVRCRLVTMLNRRALSASSLPKMIEKSLIKIATQRAAKTSPANEDRTVNATPVTPLAWKVRLV